MEELKLIVELLGNVSQHALIGTVAYLAMQFFKAPVILLTIGYVINSVLKNFRVEKKGRSNE